MLIFAASIDLMLRFLESIPKTATSIQQLHAHLGFSFTAFHILPWWWSHRCWPCSYVLSLSFRFLLDNLVLIVSAGTRTSASVSGLSTTSRSTTRLVVVVVTLSGRRAYKRKVDRDGLIEQLCVVDSFDGSLCLVQCGEFNQDVALT